MGPHDAQRAVAEEVPFAVFLGMISGAIGGLRYHRNDPAVAELLPDSLLSDIDALSVYDEVLEERIGEIGGRDELSETQKRKISEIFTEAMRKEAARGDD